MGLAETAHVLMDWLRENEPRAVREPRWTTQAIAEAEQRTGARYPASWRALAPIVGATSGVFPDGIRLYEDIDGLEGEERWIVLRGHWSLLCHESDSAEHDPLVEYSGEPTEDRLDHMLEGQLERLTSGELHWHDGAELWLELPVWSVDALLSELAGHLERRLTADERFSVHGLGSFYVNHGHFHTAPDRGVPGRTVATFAVVFEPQRRMNRQFERWDASVEGLEGLKPRLRRGRIDIGSVGQLWLDDDDVRFTYYRGFSERVTAPLDRKFNAWRHDKTSGRTKKKKRKKKKEAPAPPPPIIMPRPKLGKDDD